MPNNMIKLRGYLLVEQERYMDGSPVVSGWIYTGFPATGDRHPFVASGKPADIILAQTYHMGNRQDRIPRSLHWVVVVNGKLISHGRKAFVEVKLASFFDVSDPISMALPHPPSTIQDGITPQDLAVQRLVERRSVIVNEVEMQGFLHIDLSTRQQVQIGEGQLEMVSAVIATDERALGGRHQLLIGGNLVPGLNERFGESLSQESGVQVTVFGKLVSTGYRVYVLANLIGAATSDED